MKMEFDMTKVVEEIAMQAKENQEEFIFETIRPYCENILQIKINKEELKQILLNGAQKQQPCGDAVSRAYIESIVEELENICMNGDEHILSLLSNIKNAPSVTPSDKALKEAYIKGYDYGVKDWFKAKTEKPDIKAEIINRIEQVRDMDKNAGEYPYNRCIEIIKEVMG